MTLKKPLRLAGALVLTALAATLAASPAHAADPFKPTPQSCVGAAGCTGIAQGSGLWDVEVSPDGKFAYGSAWGNDALHVFTRDAISGNLTWKQCYSNTATAPCAPAKGIDQTDEIQISANGEFLYVSSWTGAVAAFDVNKADGLLTQLNCISADGTSNAVAAQCIDGRSVTGAQGLQLSPDGKHLYAGQNGGGVVVVRIEADGSVSQPNGAAGCINNTGAESCADGRALNSSMRQIAISADGSQVFVPNSTHRGIAVLDRNADTGALTQATGTSGCVSFDGNSGELANPCSTEARIGTNVEAVQRVGEQVYLMHTFGITTFARQAGGLAFQSCVNDAGSDGCANGRNIVNRGYAEPSPDGQHLLVNSLYSTTGLTILARDAQGNLSSPAGKDACLNASGAAHDGGGSQADGCTVNVAVGGHGKLDFADDNRFYVANYNTNGIANVSRDFYPQCASKTVDVAYNTSKQVDLTCSDRNGEAVALEIVAAPLGGSLGAIDQDNDRVFYNPFAGFSGADKFTYRAQAGALTSDAATVNLSVGAPPTDNDKDGVSPPADCDDNNAAVRPGATEVPGNAVDEDCLNGPQALPPGKIAAGVDYFFDARNKRFTKVGRLDVTNLIAGATLQVRCIGGKKKGCRFKSKKRTFAKAAAKFSAKRYFNFTKKVRKKKRKIVSKLKKGTKIELRVTAPGMIGKVITFKTRSGKVPTFTVTCLPVGATKPQKAC